jgi:hypothetical protein
MWTEGEVTKPWRKRHRTLGDFQDIFIMWASKLHEIWLVPKKEDPTFGALAQRSYVINLFLAIEYDLNMEGGGGGGGTQEGQCASFSWGPLVLNFIALGPIKCI